MTRARWQLALWCVTGLLAAACGGGSDAPPTAPSPGASTSSTSFATYQSTHFTFRYTAIDESSVTRTAALVEAEVDRIMTDLGVTSMPTVVVTLYPTSDALRAAVAPLVGAIPSFATGLATSAEAVHILSPSLPAVWPYATAVGNLVHEFAHCVSMRLNASIANNPRWLWESVALFEARQFDDAATSPYVTGTPPSLATLNTLENTTIYGVGAWLGRFIVETRGWDGYRALIRGNGDLARVFGTTEAAFLSEWAAFVRRAMQAGTAGGSVSPL